MSVMEEERDYVPRTARNLEVPLGIIKKEGGCNEVGGRHKLHNYGTTRKGHEDLNIKNKRTL
jgi:hypothetical protein